MDLFRVRLNCVDHYQATPSELDSIFGNATSASQRKNAPQVPVIRVFGATETGQKVCAHVHGALPYLYLEYDGSLEEDELNANIHSLRVSIDHALAISYRRNPYDGKATFVAHITLVKAVPFYGYNVGYRNFLKVYILNPLNMTRLADLLYQGAVLKRVLQPYESHLQYLLQWMCDYNLYGCAYIDCDKPMFRYPIPVYLELNSSSHKWHDRTIPNHMVSDPDHFPRQSHCSIEVDICVQDIVNRKGISPRPLHHDFVERLNIVSPEEKLVQSMAGLWRDETRRRKKKMGLKDPSSSPFPPEVLISMSADARNADKGGWIHEDEYRGLVGQLIDDERSKKDNTEVSFENFVQPKSANKRLKTALESVEDLFPENLSKTGGFGDGLLETDSDESKNHSQAIVDESTILQFNSNELLYDSDEEAAHASVSAKALDADATGEVEVRNGRDLPEVDDEARPDGEAYGQQFEDPEDQTAAPLMSQSSVNSRAELDSSHSSNQSQFDREPSKLVKDYVVQAQNEEPVLQLRTGDAHAMKRRKLSHRSKTTSQSSSAPAMRSLKLRDNDPTSLSAMDLGDLVRQDGGNDNVGLKDTPEALEGSQKQSSQDNFKVHGNHGMSTLPFPVVKNPHDPDTALRLSQRSGLSSSQKTSQSSGKKAVNFSGDTSPFYTSRYSKQSSLATTSTATFEPLKLQNPGRLIDSFERPPGSRLHYFGSAPPSAEYVESTMTDYGRPPVIYQDAFYSDENDVPDRARQYAGREFKLQSTSLPYLPEFDQTAESLATLGEKPPIMINKPRMELALKRRRLQCTLRNWEIVDLPPPREEIVKWLEEGEKRQRAAIIDSSRPTTTVYQENERKPEIVLSQIEGPTQKNKHGFKYSQKQSSTSVHHETQYMSTMSLEVHVNSRNELSPDPAEDEINSVFWCVQSDEEEIVRGGSANLRVGIIVLSKDENNLAERISRQAAVEVEQEEDELDLINRLVDLVRTLDPDILTGFEVHNGSWGYLIERARVKYEYNLPDELSRMKSQSHGRFGKDADRWGFTHTSTIRITGRHMINIWRAMRSELNLLQYTMENVVFHLLHLRIPHYTFRDLTRWYKSSQPRDLAKAIQYYLDRVQLDLQILDANELIPRTSEQARLLGVDFFSVFSRGSQFKVESLMFRIAKPENFVLVSPSRKQVGQQNALECLPLVMEPQSAFYPSPLLVLDFQSLYPSVMIAYNYCYSTCLGRIVNWRGSNKMGFMDFKREPRLLELVSEHINIAPNGIMYVKPTMRKSLLAKMLAEILETRVMVKSGMKVDKDDRTLQQLLNNRQLALKLIANVTYGYTSASFSGRMPCSEIADSIVQTGRETLEKAIALIHSVSRWNAEVVYGDTDSLFVYLKGRTRDQAFQIGNEIAEAVTNQNPRPVKLKFEKVYHPCVLMAKKRYVGHKYESPSQKDPEFDAKGIETVRRDGTPAEQKIEEKALKLLFRTADLSQIKRYFQDQCTKIMRGKVSIQDFCFAKEVKLGTYSERGPPPPGALIATKRMLADHRAEPQYGERVPYVVVAGAPGARLIDRCVAPEELLADEEMELDAEYYISKNLIPPLERIFNLVGANVRQWYDEMPKVQRVRTFGAVVAAAGAEDGGGRGFLGQVQGKKTLERYLQRSACLVCRTKLPQPKTLAESKELPLCSECQTKPSTTVLALRTRLQKAEEKVAEVERVCRSCANLPWSDDVRCDSRDCPVFYTRLKARTKERVEKAGVGEVLSALEAAEVKKQDLEW
ncbi:MAG: DNA polymerase zeta [Bogoriella megaspora]|nr:MAG: DNA polymerase zeta [Bogoriella megaspora]